jgi:16S rRNA (guanine966-N2)-methyltransferase
MGGQARGRLLREPVMPGVRPTSGRTREALFSMIGQNLDGVRFLDAFGGSGLVGLEAWSRGAEVCVIEKNRAIFRSLMRRGEELAATWQAMCGDVIYLTQRLGTFDVVFADPPYKVEPSPILGVLAPLTEKWLVFETAKDTHHLEPPSSSLLLDRRRTYGKSTLWVFKRS